MAGDRPFLRLLAEPYVLGGFSAAILRGGAGRWFHEYAEVETRYRCGSMEWQIRDSAPGDPQVVLTVVPLHGTGGFALRFRGQGLLSGNKLVWAFGSASHEVNVRSKWDPVMRGNPKLYRTGDPRKEEASLGLDPARCRGNHASVTGQEFRLLASDGAVRTASGKCDRETKVHLADGSAWADPAKLLESTADQLPMICGVRLKERCG